MANERITFSITLDRGTALHLQEMAHDGGLLLSEMAARCLTSIAEDDRRAHETEFDNVDRSFGLARLLPAKGETQAAGGIDRSPVQEAFNRRDDREDEAERRRSTFKVLDGVGDVRPAARVINEGLSLSLDEIAESTLPKGDVERFFSGCMGSECGYD